MPMQCMTNTSRNKQLKQAVHKVKGFLEESLSDLKEIWAKRIEYTFSIACPCDVDSCHLLPFVKCLSQEVVFCERRKPIHTAEIKEQFGLESDADQTRDTTDEVDQGAEDIQIEHEAEETDFKDVVELLRPEELQHLYIAMGIPHAQAEKAEKKANTSDVELKGMEVLYVWKQMNGPKATRNAILKALEKCSYISSKQQLENIWKKKYLLE
ncbi:uncharacterized protein [Amphiura filiformis]|uniref:uncharacterized protein n=1 Tax=Amphiura filiformis TaxID=82378 RepID=UPI003B2176D3